MHHFLLHYMLHYINYAHKRQLCFYISLLFLTQAFAHNVIKMLLLLHLTKFKQLCIICYNNTIYLMCVNRRI